MLGKKGRSVVFLSEAVAHSSSQLLEFIENSNTLYKWLFRYITNYITHKCTQLCMYMYNLSCHVPFPCPNCQVLTSCQASQGFRPEFQTQFLRRMQGFANYVQVERSGATVSHKAIVSVPGATTRAGFCACPELLFGSFWWFSRLFCRPLNLLNGHP